MRNNTKFDNNIYFGTLMINDRKISLGTRKTLKKNKDRFLRSGTKCLTE